MNKQWQSVDSPILWYHTTTGGTTLQDQKSSLSTLTMQLVVIIKG